MEDITHHIIVLCHKPMLLQNANVINNVTTIMTTTNHDGRVPEKTHQINKTVSLVTKQIEQN